MISISASVEEQTKALAIVLELEARTKGITQTANYMNANRESLSRTLRNAVNMKLSTAVKLADALGMEIRILRKVEN